MCDCMGPADLQVVTIVRIIMMSSKAVTAVHTKVHSDPMVRFCECLNITTTLNISSKYKHYITTAIQANYTADGK